MKGRGSYKQRSDTAEAAFFHSITFLCYTYGLSGMAECSMLELDIKITKGCPRWVNPIRSQTGPRHLPETHGRIRFAAQTWATHGLGHGSSLLPWTMHVNVYLSSQVIGWFPRYCISVASPLTIKIRLFNVK
jgi:hypothetical protein